MSTFFGNVNINMWPPDLYLLENRFKYFLHTSMTFRSFTKKANTSSLLDFSQKLSALDEGLARIKNLHVIFRNFGQNVGLTISAENTVYFHWYEVLYMDLFKNSFKTHELGDIYEKRRKNNKQEKVYHGQATCSEANH